MKTSNKNGSDYHIGQKSIHDLYPSKIKEKVQSESKIKEWDEQHKQAVAAVSREIEAWDAEFKPSKKINKFSQNHRK